ncbi:MAG: Bug family tripartite tricarboxylate transporter substrate binding protein [Thermodesulfobacteriota bacterium]
MRGMMGRSLLSVFVTIVALLSINAFCPGKTMAAGADWPSQNVTLIVPYPPGGGFDLVARVTAPFIEKYLPKRANVIVKNVPGAGSRIGTRELVKSKPDGLTIGILDPMGLSLMELGGGLDWLETRKLSWLVRLDDLADMLLVGPKTGYTHPKDMKGKVVRIAAPDDGGVMRGGVLARNIGTTPQFVRYNGTGDAILAMVRGDCDAIAMSWSSGMRQVKASGDKVIPLFVSSKVPGLNVPSAQEFGIEVEEIIVGHIHMLAAPPGLSPEIRTLWEEVFSKLFKDQNWFDQMSKPGYPASPLLGKDKQDALVAKLMERMGHYRDIISSLSLVK